MSGDQGSTRGTVGRGSVATMAVITASVSVQLVAPASPPACMSPCDLLACMKVLDGTSKANLVSSVVKRLPVSDNYTDIIVASRQDCVIFSCILLCHA